MLNTHIYPFDNHNAVNLAQMYLQKADIIVAPTDTVYGLMAKYDCPSAIEQLYVIKERPISKAIPVLIGDIHQLEAVAYLPDAGKYGDWAMQMMKRWWPGPLTLVLQAHPDLPDVLTAGQKTIAVRIPDHDRLRQLIRQVGPLAATSANLSEHAETTDASAVLAQLAGRVPAIFDGGSCTGGIASTIVDLTRMQGSGTSGSDPISQRPIILRTGPLADEISATL